MRAHLLLVDKEPGLRSTRCVEIVRSRLGRNIKVGHAGTLDGPASGLLLILLGSATRLSDYAMKLPKTYRVTLKLGIETTTGDITGSVTRTMPVSGDAEERLRRATCAFLGMRLQRPPAFSAVRVNGERAHRLARKGKTPPLEARPVFIRSIRVTSPVDEDGYVSMVVECHKGTYIRSLAFDIGRKIGCGATVSSLRRVALGSLAEAQSLSSRLLPHMDREALLRHLLPVERLLDHFTAYEIDQYVEEACWRGQAIKGCPGRRLSWGMLPTSEGVALVGERGVTFCEVVLSSGGASFYPKVNVPLEGEIAG
ncbi:MAG TPA: tRNA pseudouridine(55) synthase TruB [Thermosynergistes sp.]|nr:tRNA pseudouridine(55) synthase TruB [Thermosynergistes sp.]